MSETPWAQWRGRSQTVEDTIHDRPAELLAATLDRQDQISCAAGSTLPPLWNWLYFLQPAPMAKVGPDGHPERGGFLPPVEHPRRMWAGSRISFHAPISIGASARKTSTIASIDRKEGRAGPMVFVTVDHEIHSGDVLALRESQDIVYMDIPEVWRPPPAKPVPACDWQEPLRTDPVFLFRFSALTFNGHRIHYDRPYAMDVENYPGLVVHGPLQAILLFDAAVRQAPERRPLAFAFRGVHPLFDFDSAQIHGRDIDDNTSEIYTANGDGAVCMKATMRWA